MVLTALTYINQTQNTVFRIRKLGWDLVLAKLQYKMPELSLQHFPYVEVLFWKLEFWRECVRATKGFSGLVYFVFIIAIMF